MSNYFFVFFVSFYSSLYLLCIPCDVDLMPLGIVEEHLKTYNHQSIVVIVIIIIITITITITVTIAVTMMLQASWL